MLSDDIDTKLISCLQGVLINDFKMNLNFMTIGDFNYVLRNLSALPDRSPCSARTNPATLCTAAAVRCNSSV